MKRRLIALLVSFAFTLVGYSSGESSLGVVTTEVTVRTLLGQNGFKLAMDEDTKSGTESLSKLIVRWNGHEITYSRDALPMIERPALPMVSILGVDGREDVMILVIPYAMRRSDDSPPTFNAAKLVFVQGQMKSCTLAESVPKEDGKWRLSDYDLEKGKLDEPQIEKYDANPFLKNWQTGAERAEAGADQTATRPESDSEGGDKPQSEAEGRSR